MPTEYSVATIRKLKESFQTRGLLRPLWQQRYDAGDELEYEIQSLVPKRNAQVKLEVEKFVGGGFAGQVYRVKVHCLNSTEGPLPGLEEGKSYALKILIPASGFVRLFRGIVYALGFQAPFSIQVNPAAARAGALWQKFIRRGARLKFDTDSAVVDVLATLVDPRLGSCGEISEWIDGRLWRYEVDDNLDARRRWRVGHPDQGIGSPEYRAKKTFMSSLVNLLHEMGAPELARQYEWWTCKSQPNALKRLREDPDPQKGHVAVDFRAGLALLPFLPMSPADFKLILQGIRRGSLVQFDRGNLTQLQRFMEQNPADFTDMQQAFAELQELEKAYRDSMPDISHHHVRLLGSRRLWKAILEGNVTGLAVRNLVDEAKAGKLQTNQLSALGYTLLGLIPFLGRFLRRFLGHRTYRKHYLKFLTSPAYASRTWKARRSESLIRWHRVGRVDAERALKLNDTPIRFMLHLLLSLLPAGAHRFLSDRHVFSQKLFNIFVKPLRLYFKAEEREKWLRDMISQGEGSGMLTPEESARIVSQIKEPFIQKYLKSLAVHVCTVPVTQIVSVLVAIIYVRLHPELSWQEASVHAGIILGLFQVVPISPGSLARGIYVTILVIKERNFKDYNLAFFLSFFKYIGYLAFPIQMAYRYPDLARFMAGHWATEIVHIVPVFGERGALLEHTVFDTFYNFPLTIRRRIQKRQEARASQKPRFWHVPLLVMAGSAVLAGMDVLFFQTTGHIPRFGEIWWFALWIPLFIAAFATAGAGGATLGRRISSGVLSGTFIGMIYAVSNTYLRTSWGKDAGESLAFLQILGQMTAAALWLIFLFTLVAVLGALAAETRPLSRKLS